MDDTEREIQHPEGITDSVEHPEFRGLTAEPLTVEGQIEAVGRLAAGISRAKPWQRWTLRGLVILWAAVLAVGLVVSFVSAWRSR